VCVDSADDAAAKVTVAGGRRVLDPFDLMNAARIATFTDLEGAAFGVWQAKEHKGARTVNQPGSLNLNALNARDTETAESFYGAVFGWGTVGLEGGAMAWTLAGYGDFVKQSDPELPRRMAEAGVPAGFEDVVAMLVPLADDQPDVPAHWGVTFAVDDADAIASKASELGGKVILPPLDAPWVRMTMIADPQGATFIASKFVPENRDAAAQGPGGETIGEHEDHHEHHGPNRHHLRRRPPCRPPAQPRARAVHASGRLLDRQPQRCGLGDRLSQRRLLPPQARRAKRRRPAPGQRDRHHLLESEAARAA
jgi:hypothetical protein